MLRKCIYGGGDSCKRQGGDGSLDHGFEYFHPFTTTAEVGHPVGDFVRKSEYSTTQDHQISLPTEFNEDKSAAILSLEISKGIDIGELIKSLYDFDIESEEGIQKIMELLPVLDPIIVVELVEKLWPGYAVEDADPDLLRAEVRGFLMDYLDGRFEDAGTFEPTDFADAEATPEGGAVDEAEVGAIGDESGIAEEADAEEGPAEEAE